MTAVNQNITMYQGDSKVIEVQVTDKDGNALNITGAVIKWGVLQRVTSSAILVLKSNADGVTITDAINGVLEIELNPEDTEDLSGVYYHEASLTDVDNNVSTILVGSLTLNKSGI